MHATTSFRLAFPRRPILTLAAFFLVIAGAVAPAGVSAANSELSGRTDAGAYYRIVVPDNWNGDLVIFANGIEADNVRPDPPLSSLADYQLAAGFAVATTSYRTNFYTLFRSRADLKDLVRIFVAQVGKPSRIFLEGLSQGGLVAAEALEKDIGGEVAGALIYCGMLGGGPYLDMFVDLRLAYDVECDNVPGAAIPGGATGLSADAGLTFEDVVGRIVTCTGVDPSNFVPSQPVVADQAQMKRQENLLRFSTVPNGEFLLEDLLVGVFAVSDVFHDPTKMNGGLGYTNVDVAYPGRRFDREIERVEGDPKARRRLLKHFTPKGKVRNGARVVALHEAFDGFVFVENLGEYASKVRDEQLSLAVAVADAPSHCDFTPAELRAGWDEMLAWVDGGEQPNASSIQSSCKALSAGGTASGPCRLDEDYPLGRLADRVPAR